MHKKCWYKNHKNKLNVSHVVMNPITIKQITDILIDYKSEIEFTKLTKILMNKHKYRFDNLPNFTQYYFYMNTEGIVQITIRINNLNTLDWFIKYLS